MVLSKESTFLDLFPREIRDQLYREVLAPTGYIVVSSYDPPSPISNRKFRFFSIERNDMYCSNRQIGLSFLRTNKQIHHEAKDILFKHNFLNTEVSGRSRRHGCDSLSWCFNSLPDPLKFNIQKFHIEIDLDVESHGQQGDSGSLRDRLSSIFVTLDALRRAGNLKIVDLKVVYRSTTSVQGLLNLSKILRRPLSDESRMFENYLDILRTANAWRSDGVKKRIFFEFHDIDNKTEKDGNFPTDFVSPTEILAQFLELLWFDKGGCVERRDLDDLLIEEGNTIHVLAAIHNALGGELYFGGRLCFRDGEIISDSTTKIIIP